MDDLLCRCKRCKKAPKNCRCFTYRLEPWTDQNRKSGIQVYVDNIATQPVRGQPITTWTSKIKKVVYARPSFIDGFGPILYTSDPWAIEQIKEDIGNGLFYLYDWMEVPNVSIRKIEKSVSKRMPFLRKPRRRAGTV